MDKNNIEPAEGGMTRNSQTVIVLIGVVISTISTGAVFVIDFNREINEGFRQHALVINQNHADLMKKADADFKALLRKGDEDRRELFRVIEDRRVETDEKLDDQREELYQIKLDFQVGPDTR